MSVRQIAEQADVSCTPDGIVTVRIGSMSNGQSHETVYAQMAAEAGFKAVYLSGGSLGWWKCVTEANITLPEMAFVAFLTSPRGQSLIGAFRGKAGRPLFEPLAAVAGVDLVK